MSALPLPPLLVWAAALYLPVMVVIALAVHARPDRRRVAGALLATCWAAAALLAVNLAAGPLGWWQFMGDTVTVGGVPAELWVGWALLWGAVPILATTRPAGLATAGGALVAADLALMPLAEPVVALGPTWLAGEAVAVVTALVPGLLLGSWTATGTRLAGRVLLQVVAFTAWAFFVLVSLIFTVTGESWDPLLERPRWHFVAAAVLLALVGAMTLQAVREFAAHGGTPVPLDPPKRLVTTGPYAYLANPMQLGGTILLAVWGVLLESAAVVAAAAAGAALSAGLFAWHEEHELADRFGDAWHAYRKQARLMSPAGGPRPARRPPSTSPRPATSAARSATSWPAAAPPGWRSTRPSRAPTRCAGSPTTARKTATGRPASPPSATASSAPTSPGLPRAGPPASPASSNSSSSSPTRSPPSPAPSTSDSRVRKQVPQHEVGHSEHRVPCLLSRIRS
jgi:protein-S-isoprenylcysteine O-methyltransferase Ste14